MTSTTDNDLLPDFATCPYCEAHVERGLINMAGHFDECPKYPRTTMKSEVTREDVQELFELLNKRSTEPMYMEVGWGFVQALIDKLGEEGAAQALKGRNEIRLLLSTDTWEKWKDFATRNGLMETK